MFVGILLEKRMLLTLGILAVYSLVNNVNDNYWATFVVDTWDYGRATFRGFP